MYQVDDTGGRRVDATNQYAYEHWKNREFQYAITVRARTRREGLDLLLKKFAVDELLYIGMVK